MGKQLSICKTVFKHTHKLARFKVPGVKPLETKNFFLMLEHSPVPNLRDGFFYYCKRPGTDG